MKLTHIILILQSFVFIILVKSLSVKYNPNSIKLGIDYGPRLIGIAVSDRLGKVHPLLTLPNTRNLTEVSLDIINIIQSKGALDIILGIPLDSNGKLHYKVRNFNGGLCLQFSQILSCIVNKHLPQCQVCLVDERYSTREAKQKLKSDKNVKASIDAMSAACLIERFLEDEGEYSILAQPCSYPPPVELELLDYSTVSEYVRESREQEQSPIEYQRMRMQQLKVSSAVMIHANLTMNILYYS